MNLRLLLLSKTISNLNLNAHQYPDLTTPNAARKVRGLLIINNVVIHSLPACPQSSREAEYRRQAQVHYSNRFALAYTKCMLSRVASGPIDFDFDCGLAPDVARVSKKATAWIGRTSK